MFRKSKDVIIEFAVHANVGWFLYVCLALFGIPVVTINNLVLVNVLISRIFS